VRLGKGGERVDERAVHLELEGDLVRAGRALRTRREPLALAAAAGGAPAVARQVAHDAGEPGRGGRVRRRRVAPGRDPGVLHQVVGLRAVGGERRGQRAHARGVGEELLERESVG
jgi:hypothetical protein